MENKLEKISQNSFMDNFVKTDDILKDICGITESLQKVAYRTVKGVSQSLCKPSN